MSERQQDIAVVAVFLSLLTMMASIAWATRFEIVCAIVGVAALLMGSHRGLATFSSHARRSLRAVVLVVSGFAAVAIYCSRVDGCVVWPAFIAVASFTYLSLRLRMFSPSSSKVE